MDNDVVTDEPESEEKASAEVAEKPAETQVSEPQEPSFEVVVPVREKKAEPPADSGDDDVEGFSFTGSLPEPKTKFLAVLAAGVLALDVLTKVVAVAFLEDADPIKIFGGLLHLTFVRNPGAAFGLAEGWTWILALIAFGVAGFIVWISRNLRSQGWAVGLGLVLGGAVGNLADRLFREPGPMRGHVVDFLSLFDPYGRVWPVFNIADMAIVGGGATIIVLALMRHDYDGTISKDEDVLTPAPAPAGQDGLQEPK
ncbi:signal peptidase II [Lentzea sp.]|uniref:signal peptidase II n=1 Tax=Lentzea sp. TaxID=56099 RepID=UPI002ED4A4B7